MADEAKTQLTDYYEEGADGSPMLDAELVARCLDVLDFELRRQSRVLATMMASDERATIRGHVCELAHLLDVRRTLAEIDTFSDEAEA